VARPRNQDQRRRELIAATESALAQRGLNGVRLRDVAEAAGMTPGAVLYYYDGLDDLFFAVYARGIDRFCREREEAIARIDDPIRQLATAIHLGIPPSSDDADIRLLYEFEAVAFRNNACATLMHGYVERQVLMYSSILDHGRRTGAFQLASDSRTIARNIVGLEDAHGVYILTGHRQPAEVERLVLDYATTTTGVGARTFIGARKTVEGPGRGRPHRPPL
jgi:AcrR family transcriptional regulator